MTDHNMQPILIVTCVQGIVLVMATLDGQHNPLNNGQSILPKNLQDKHCTFFHCLLLFVIAVLFQVQLEYMVYQSVNSLCKLY
jgi:hypothetical protein